MQGGFDPLIGLWNNLSRWKPASKNKQKKKQNLKKQDTRNDLFTHGKSVCCFVKLFFVNVCQTVYVCGGGVVTKLCPTLCDPMDCSPPGSSVSGISPSRNTGVGCHFLLQGIFPTQESNLSLLSLLHCRWILYCQVNDINLFSFDEKGF